MSSPNQSPVARPAPYFVEPGYTEGGSDWGKAEQAAEYRALWIAAGGEP